MAQWRKLSPRLVSICELYLIIILLIINIIVEGHVPYCKRFFPGTLLFPSPQKTTFPIFNSIPNLRAKGLLVIRLLSITLVK